MSPLPAELATLLLAESPDMISWHDADGTCQWASAAAESVIGYKPATVIGGPGLFFVHPVDAEWVHALLLAIEAPTHLLTYRAYRADGRKVWLETHVRRVSGHLLLVTRDVSVRILTAAGAVESPLALAAAISGLGLAEYTAGHDLIRLSAEFMQLLGRPTHAAEVPVTELLPQFAPIDIRGVFSHYLRALEDGEHPVPIRLRGHRLDTGAPFAVLVVARIVPVAPRRIQCAAFDVTSLAEAEQAAADAQAELAFAAEATGLGLSVRDVASEKIAVTSAFAQLYGLPVGTTHTKLATLLDLTHPDDRRVIRPAFEAALQVPGSTGQAQFRIRRADTGEERTLVSTAQAEAGPAGIVRRVLSVTLDVTESAQARRASEQLSYWQNLTDGLPEIMWVANADASVTQLLNRRWYAYTGQSPQVLQDQSWAEAVHPDDRGNQEISRRVADDRPYEVKMRLRRHDGQYRWFLVRAVPLHDPTGAIINWVGLTVDVHEHELTEQRLRQANADLDTFVYAVAHDLKSPIDNLEGILSALADEIDARRRQFPAADIDAAQDVLIDHATRAVARFRATLADLAQVVDAHTLRPHRAEAIDLATHVADLLLDMEAEFAAAGGQLCLDLRVPTLGGLPARHLRSLLFNLISNALKYRAPERPARLWLRVRPKGADYVELSVTDNGLGLDSARAARAFELFGRLHPGAAGGTGIGLFIVRRIVEQAGGTLAVYGRAGRGTRFSVQLPAG